MSHIKKGHTVYIIAGKDKGKKGEAIKVNPRMNTIVVKGLNIVKKTVKKSKENPSGGFIELEAPIHLSNVMLVCPKCNKPTRTGVVITAKGEKSVVCKHKNCNGKIE